MITHIVMIKFKVGTSTDVILDIKKSIEELTNTIKEISYMEVGLNFISSERAMDLVLTSKFKSKEDLTIYADDANHKIVKDKIKEYAEYTRVVDYINE